MVSRCCGAMVEVVSNADDPYYQCMACHHPAQLVESKKEVGIVENNRCSD